MIRTQAATTLTPTARILDRWGPAAADGAWAVYQARGPVPPDGGEVRRYPTRFWNASFYALGILAYLDDPRLSQMSAIDFSPLTRERYMEYVQASSTQVGGDLRWTLASVHLTNAGCVVPR